MNPTSATAPALTPPRTAPPQARQPLPPPRLTSFADLSLRSEIFRAGAFNSLLMAALALAMVRALLHPEAVPFGPRHFALALIPLGYGALYIGALRAIASPAGRIPRWLWISNIALESLLPTAIILVVLRTHRLPPALAVTSPAMLAYALVLIMSALRLNPAICIASGVICSAGHAALIYFSGAGADAASIAAHGLPQTALFSYSLLIFVLSIAAALVAAQLRAHLTNLVGQAQRRERAENEIAFAAEVQQGLLPKSPPQFDGFDIAMWNPPADETGGDYYDWQPLPDGRLAVTLADVSGHGLGPALMAAFCRAYARAAMHGGPRGLGPAMSHVNTLLTDDLPPGRFVTLAAAVLSRDSDEVGLLSAGHGPILIHRARGGEIESRGADSLPLGVDGSMHYETGEPIRLADGDSLIFITDGFFEWTNAAGERFGIQRLSDRIRDSASSRSAAATIESMRRGVESFVAGAPQSDDLTAVVIRRHRAAR